MKDVKKGRNRKKKQRSHKHYVALVWDSSTGHIAKASSPLFHHCENDVLEKAVSKLSHHIRLLNSSRHRQEIEELSTNEGKYSPNIGLTVPDISSDEFELDSNHDLSSTECPKESISLYRESNVPIDETAYVSFRADDSKKWNAWFYDAFQALQQINCRFVAKEWIRTIHPSKQRTHPYNGKNPRSKKWEGPDMTKPPYWPADVVHREPDHILKEERIRLLVHIITKTPHRVLSADDGIVSTRIITADTLKQPLSQKKHDIQNSELLNKFSIVEHITNVRTELEQYESGLIAPSTMINAPDLRRVPRNARLSTSADKIDRSTDSSELDRDSEDSKEATPEPLQPSQRVLCTCSDPHIDFESNINGTTTPLGDRILPVRCTPPKCDGCRSSTSAQRINDIDMTNMTQWTECSPSTKEDSFDTCQPYTAGVDQIQPLHTIGAAIAPELAFECSDTGWGQISSIVPSASSFKMSGDTAIHPPWNDTTLLATFDSARLHEYQPTQPSTSSFPAIIDYSTWQISEWEDMVPLTNAPGQPSHEARHLLLDPGQSLHHFGMSHPPMVSSNAISSLEQSYSNYWQRICGSLRDDNKPSFHQVEHFDRSALWRP